ERNAEKAFALARTFYEGGLKSDNKRYDVDMAPWYKKSWGSAAEANWRVDTARVILDKTHRTPGYQTVDDGHGATRDRTRIEKGSLLVRGGVQAANCGELTNVACYYATQCGADPDELFAANFTAPADHAFCVFGSKEEVFRNLMVVERKVW